VIGKNHSEFKKLVETTRVKYEALGLTKEISDLDLWLSSIKKLRNKTSRSRNYNSKT
jgi:hypothetical protein